MSETVDRAREHDILATAKRLGATLKRAGREWVGPCPICGGRDTFGVNPTKRVFICRRGQAGGDVVALAMHLRGGSYLDAARWLVGERAPEPVRKPVAAVEPVRAPDNRERAFALWRASKPISGTVAETYLRKRKINYEVDFASLRFHPGGLMLVGAVVGPDGVFRGVWRIFLSPTGDKANVESPKKGLGPCAGGAIWLGKPAPVINVVEGLETGLGVVGLLHKREPVAVTCSTAGMRGFEIPAGTALIRIWPDGDRPKLQHKAGESRILASPGLAAAAALRERAKAAGVDCVIQPTPMNGKDYLDVYASAVKREWAGQLVSHA